jgi:hypothetical protein
LLTYNTYVMVEPGMAFVMLSVFVMPRSPFGVTLSVSAAELFELLFSIVPAAGATTTELISVFAPAGVFGFNVPITV